jgi:hypothetical protein
VTAAASVHVRIALDDKAFDEAPSRGLALTLGDAVAYAEREALAAIKETGRSEPSTLIIIQQSRMPVVGLGCAKAKNGLPANFCFWRIVLKKSKIE